MRSAIEELRFRVEKLCFLIERPSFAIERTHSVFESIRQGLVEHPDDYLYSSARIWHRKPLDNEPLEMNLDEIEWRKS